MLGVFLLAAALAVWLTSSPLARGNADKDSGGRNDVVLYRAEVERIHGGQDYYEAASAELHARGYPTRSVFNWRTPLPLWPIGRLPAIELGKAILGGLALVLMLLAFEAMAREAAAGDPSSKPVPWTAVGCVVLLTGPLMLCVLGDLFVMPVLWAGVLLALSLCAYGIDRPDWGVGLGLGALLLRELSLPYCVLCLALAVVHRKRGEAIAWGAGLTLWLVFFAWHWHQASQWITPNDRAHTEGWVRFGGAAFLISTVQISAWLLLLPQWVSALVLVTAMLSFAAWNTPMGRRFALTAALYAVAFSLVGQDFNQYWGAMLAPLWCFGVARFPVTIRDLCRSAIVTLSHQARDGSLGEAGTG